MPQTPEAQAFLDRIIALPQGPGVSLHEALQPSLEDEAALRRMWAQDKLNALLTMAQLKYDNFMATVKDTADSTLIPVDKILMRDWAVNAGVTNNPDNIKKAISDAAGAFASNDILAGTNVSG